MVQICDLPVFVRTALVFEQNPQINEIVIVVKADEYDTVKKLCAGHAAYYKGIAFFKAGSIAAYGKHLK